MKYGYLLILLLGFGCNHLETQKIYSDEISKQELQQIDWRGRNLPRIKNCSHCVEKIEKKKCFEQKVSEYFYQKLETQHYVVNDSIDQTIFIYIKITAQAQPVLDSLQADEQLYQMLPQLDSLMHTFVKNMPVIEPAYKRGVPITTSFKLPLQIKTTHGQ